MCGYKYTAATTNLQTYPNTYDRRYGVWEGAARSMPWARGPRWRVLMAFAQSPQRQRDLRAASSQREA